MDNACIIGNGVVGKATAHALGIKKHFDKYGSNITLKQASKLRYVFICLPTPVNNGRYFVDDIREIIRQIASYGSQNVFIIRSTVYPGFAKKMMDDIGINNIISNPEFLTEKTVKEDSEHPDIIVIGGEQRNYIEDVEGIYKARFKGVDIFTTDTVTAEIAKMAINGFYALKVVFANQLYDWVQTNRGNYEKIKEIMYARKWIGKNHLEVNHQGGRGAGGKCLPKDLEALVNYSDKQIFRTAQGLNLGYLMTSHKQK